MADPIWTEAERRLLSAIEADRDKLIDFFQRFLQAPSPNPPGDTTPAVRVLKEFLDSHGITPREVAADPVKPNLVAHADGSGSGRHLVFNGHIDVFAPIDPATAWSGEIRDGNIHGRGACDMKCGTAASTIAFAYLTSMRDAWAGRATLTLVSDEETGGALGAKHLFETLGEEIAGDVCLNGEPSGTGTIRFMEKGTFRLTITVETEGGHGGYPHLSENAIIRAVEIIDHLMQFDGVYPVMPEDIAEMLARPEVMAATNANMGAGAAEIVRQLTVNVGVIKGGLKINQIPNRCRFEVEFRAPVGVDRDELLGEIRATVNAVPGAMLEIQEHHSYPPSAADPNHEMVGLLQRTVSDLGHPTPVPVSSLGGSDSRYWRWRGVPAYLYGPSPVTMGKADEHVGVEEFLHITRTHALAALRYLAAKP